MREHKDYINLVKTVVLIFLLFLSLSVREDALAAGRTIKVGIFELNGFYERVDDGSMRGYGFEYFERLAEKTGYEYKYIWAENFNECMELLRNGDIDMTAPAERTQSRIEEFDFCDYRIGDECGALLTLANNDKLIYEDFETFSNIRVGHVEGSVFVDDFIEYARKNNFSPKYSTYNSTDAVFNALFDGEIDAMLVNSMEQRDSMKLLAKMVSAPIYIMTAKDNNELLQELNEALGEMKKEEFDFEVKLMKKYFPHYDDVPFTKAELDYIEAAPEFTVGCRVNIMPISGSDENTGEMIGITTEILDEVSKISGLKFKYVPLPEGSISYDYLRDNHISLISGVEFNEENKNAKGIKLTNPYLDSNKVFVCLKEEEFFSNSYKKIAVATGSQTLSKVVKESYPNFEVVIYDSIKDCFEAVRTGEADALLQNQYVVTNCLAKPLYSNMVTIPVESLNDQVCLSPVVYQQEGVEDELLNDDRLISILDKAIYKLDEEAVTNIIIKQTSKNHYNFTAEDIWYMYRYFWIGSIVVLFAAAFIIYKYIRIKKKNFVIISQNENKLKNITNNINGGVVVLTVDDELRISYANEGFMELLQCGKDEYRRIRDKKYVTYIHPDDIHILKEIRNMDFEENNQISIRLRIMRRDGQFISTLFNGTLAENATGEKELYCVIMDISEQERLLRELSLEQEKYSIRIENSGDVLFEIDCRENNMMISSLFREIFGWDIDNYNYLNSIYDMAHILRIHRDDIEKMNALIKSVLSRHESGAELVRIMKSDGSFLWCRIAKHPMVDNDGKLSYILGEIVDINSEIVEKKELQKKSRLDPMTGLLNKSTFYEEAANYLRDSKDKNSAIVFMDIDNFKNINDTLGHVVGDEAIKEVGKMLQLIFSNLDIIARFGGDEFCILVKEIPIEALRDKLLWANQKIKGTYSADGEDISYTVSLGAACTYGKEQDLEQLLVIADKALYKAKENGKNQYFIL